MFPKVSSLIFRIQEEPRALSIHIDRTIASFKDNGKDDNPHIVSLGTFVMRGDSLVLKTVPSPHSKPAVENIAHATDFSKFTQSGRQWNDNNNANPWSGAELTIPPHQQTGTSWDTKWTLAYRGASAKKEPEGLVVQLEETVTGTSSTWLHIPEEMSTIQGSNATVRLYNVLDSDLIESATAATTFKDPLSVLSLFNEQMQLEKIPSDSDSDKKDKMIDSNWDKVSSIDAAYGKHGVKYFKETSTPYAVYNWELGLHMLSLFVERLAATRQYELALEVARLVFDPTIVAAKYDESAQWIFHPFKDISTREQGRLCTLLSDVYSTTNTDNIPQIILDWRRKPFSPHEVARNRPSAYMKRLAMKYVEILVDAGDAEFRKDTLESLPLALQFYVQASHVYGPAHQKIPKVTKTKPLTYEDLSELLDGFSNASIELELISPFFVPFNERGRAIASSTDSMGFVKTRYFTIPTNPDIIALRARIDDRLFKVRNCLDLNGKPRRTTFFSNPIDPKDLIQKSGGDRMLDEVVRDVNVSLSRYRFRFLLQKSHELCAELKALGTAYLAAKERKDSEQMMITKLNQDRFVNDLVLQMKGLQKEEACRTLEQLQQSRDSAAFRLRYFSALTGDEVRVPGEEQSFDLAPQFIGKRTTNYLRMSEEEETELDKAQLAASWTLLANAMEFSASVLSLIPPVSTQAQPWGVGITVSSPPWGQGALIAASIFKGLSMYESEQGAHAARVNRLLQQLQERRHQLNQAGLEIKATDKSIQAQRARIASIDKDEMQRKQMKNAMEHLEYLKTKFNNIDLYNYLDKQTLMAFSHTYNLAFELSRHARKAFSYETGVPHKPLVPQDYWDDARSGLMCAEKLSMSLRNLELEFLDRSYHDFEIVKHFSLRQIAPLALLRLRSQGEADFSFSELLFDFDFPGHYHRKIKSVSISIPCTISPYSTLNCVLTLKESSYRIADMANEE